MADFVKIGRASRRKGCRFQNEVAKMLSKAWKVPVLWTPMSGGLSMRGDLMVGGDPPKHVLAYNIECKHRKDVTLKRFINNADLVPVTENQVVIFRDEGETWLAFSVRGPSIGPPSLDLNTHPPYIRIRHDADKPIGFVRISGSVGAQYLEVIRDRMIRKVQAPRRPGAGRRKDINAD